MAEQDGIIEMTGQSQAAEGEATRAGTAAKKTAAKKTTAKKTTAKKTAAGKTAAKKTTAKKTTAKKTTARKTASNAQLRLSAKEKKLVQNYRKCGEAGKLMIETLAEKTAEMAGKDTDSGSESGPLSALSSIASSLDLGSLAGLLGK